MAGVAKHIEARRAVSAHTARRRFMVQSLATAGLISLQPWPVLAAARLIVPNITGLYPVEVAAMVTPRSTAEVIAAVRQGPWPVAVGGGRYSMGGQIAAATGLHLDMRQMNRMLWLKTKEKIVRVQAGMRWRDLQTQLDPQGLAIKTMQSFSNFTVGGSVSVNAHGRYVGNGPIGHSVRALQLVLADGTVVETNLKNHTELFRAAMGGYGAVGVITEVELDVVENVRIERQVVEVSLAEYVAHFNRHIFANPKAVLHNADLLPPNFDKPVCVTWYRAAIDAKLTETARLISPGQSYGLEQNVIWLLTEMPGGAQLRKKLIHPLLTQGVAVKWLNHEASLDVAELEPRTRRFSTYVLQEYFIPARHFLSFAKAMGRVLRQQQVDALNVSIRHAPADQVSLMPWAKEAVFSFVLYYKQRTHSAAQSYVGNWTRILIELALKHEGRYYLPYQLHATREQFAQCYPEVTALRSLKARIDPDGKFSNTMWSKYL